MSPILTVACLIGATVMSAAAPPPDPARAPLRVGDPFPVLEGQFLTGRDAALPQAAAGTVALVAIGFTYASRFPVEAWGAWFRETMGPRTDVALFEVPMIGGLARLGRWFIDRGMRSGTPAELHDEVITVYGNTSEWKARLSHTPARGDDAYLIVLDAAGVVRWLHHGGFDQTRADQVRTLLTSLADGVPMTPGPDGSSQVLGQ